MLSLIVGVALAIEPPKPAPPSVFEGARFQLLASGLSIATLGAVTAGGTYALYQTDPDVTASGWDRMRVANAAGWAGVGVGLGLVAVGVAWKGDDDRSAVLRVGPGHVAVDVRF